MQERGSVAGLDALLAPMPMECREYAVFSQHGRGTIGRKARFALIVDGWVPLN
jgi:hypothetical protein